MLRFGYFHRDVKPENILITVNFTSLILILILLKYHKYLL